MQVNDLTTRLDALKRESSAAAADAESSLKQQLRERDELAHAAQVAAVEACQVAATQRIEHLEADRDAAECRAVAGATQETREIVEKYEGKVRATAALLGSCCFATACRALPSTQQETMQGILGAGPLG